MPLPSVTARHELMIRAASACTATVGRSRPARRSRASQQASQFSAVWVSSLPKRFAAMARCSREPDTRFMHEGGKRVVKEEDRPISPAPIEECPDQTSRHKTLFDA